VIVEGIFTRQSIPAAGTAVRTATVNVNWSVLEATRDVITLGPIESALDTAESRGLDGVRLRVMVGRLSPQWAKELGDGPIPFQVTESGVTSYGTIPDIWEWDYRTEVRELFAAIAAQYDSDPRLRLVFATGMMTWYAESFIRSFAEAPNRTAVLAAGYTKELDADLQKWQLDWMLPFVQTPVGLAYNPWQWMNPDGTWGSSIPFMEEVMDYHTFQFGARTVLQNNSIRSSYIGAVPAMYTSFLERPGVVHQFQTAAANRVGDEEATIRWAHDYLGANGVENAGNLTNAQYAELDALLKS
jgi:hypothetical protein